MNLKFIFVLSIGLAGLHCEGLFKYFPKNPITCERALGGVRSSVLGNSPIPKPDLTVLQWSNVTWEGLTSGLLSFQVVSLFNNHPAICAAAALTLGGFRGRSRYAVERVLNEQQIQLLQTIKHNEALIAKSDKEQAVYINYLNRERNQPFRSKRRNF